MRLIWFPSPNGVLIFQIPNIDNSIWNNMEFPSPNGVLIFQIMLASDKAINEDISVS